MVGEAGDDRQVDDEGHGQSDGRVDGEVLVGLLHLLGLMGWCVFVIVGGGGKEGCWFISPWAMARQTAGARSHGLVYGWRGRQKKQEQAQAAAKIKCASRADVPAGGRGG